MKKRGLGRSLNAILSTQTATAPESQTITDTADTQADESIRLLPLTSLQRGKYQPRNDIDEEGLQALATSIRAQGVLQPLIVREVAKGKYEIIAGERRSHAAKLAGLDEVPVIIRDISDSSAMAIGLIENIQREDLNPVEEALAIQRLLEEFALTHKEVAESIGRSRTAVSNLLRLLHLHPGVLKLLAHGDLEMGHARALLGVSEPSQLAAAQHVVEKALSVRETERYVKGLQQPKPIEPVLEPSSALIKQQARLAQVLNTKVQIKQNAKGCGKVIVTYQNPDQLSIILKKIGAEN